MPAPIAKTSLVLDRGIIAANHATLLTADADPVEVQAGDAPQLIAASNKLVLADKALVAFAGPAIKLPSDPKAFADWMIAAKYASLGGAAGWLGATTTPTTVCPDGVGYFHHYKGGSIYWHPATGAHEAHGAIRAKWAALGWEKSFLGYPTTDETDGRDPAGKGRYNHFQRGSIYWHPDTGAFEMHGAIRKKYLALGADGSFLGYPTTDETGCPDGVGRFNHFQAGSIYWTPRTGAHEVHGLIRGFWAQHGWERNPELGYPLTDELIPDRGIGHIRPNPIRKPGLAFAADVVASPTVLSSAGVAKIETAGGPTFVSTATPTPVTAPVATPMTAVTTRREITAGASPATMSFVATPVATVKPAAATTVFVSPAIFTLPPKHSGKSVNRYSDFEDGVLFWLRGTDHAVKLAPRAKGPDNLKLSWSGAEIAALAFPKLQNALRSLAGCNLIAVNFTGVNDYTHDGVAPRNRAHRLTALLHGLIQVGPSPIPMISQVEVLVETGFDPVDREVVAYLSGWRILVQPGNYLGAPPLKDQLERLLDPVMWTQLSLARIPDVADDPEAVLSVKTMSDGSVAVFLEP